MKKGQITIFIILGVFILISASLFFYLKNTNNIFKENIPVEFTDIYNFIDSCMDQSAQDSISLVSQTGGYYNLPEDKTLTNIALYYNNNKNLLPSMKEIEEQISLAFSESLDSCINNFQDFESYQTDIIDNTEYQVLIKENKVSFKIKYPLEISKGENSANFKNFEKTIDSKLDDAYEIAKSVILERIINDGVCLNCLFDSAEENDLFIEMYDYDSDTTIFIIVDKTYKLNGEDFAWYFAINARW